MNKNLLLSVDFLFMLFVFIHCSLCISVFGWREGGGEGTFFYSVDLD